MRRLLLIVAAIALICAILGCDSTESNVEADAELGSWDFSRPITLTRTAVAVGVSAAPATISVSDGTLVLSTATSTTDVSTAATGSARLEMTVGEQTWVFSGNYTRNGNEIWATDLAPGTATEGYADLTLTLSSARTMTGKLQYQDADSNYYNGTCLLDK